MTSVLGKLVAQGIKDIALHPWAQFMTLLAVTFITFLAGLMLLGVDNLDKELRATSGEMTFQIYWKEDVSPKQVQSAWASLRKMKGVMELTTYTPNEALKDLASTFPQGNTSMFEGKSPLPYTAVLKFAHRKGDLAGWKEKTETTLRQLKGVDSVRSSSLKDEVAKTWEQFSGTLAWPVIIFLGFILSMAVGNTMKLSLISRKDEIEILKLVGAKNWYIRTPLLVGGATLGFTGGMLGVLTLYGIWWNLKDAFNFAPLYWEMNFLPVDQALLLIVVPMTVGIISSWVAVRS